MFRLIFTTGGGLTLPPIPDGTRIHIRYTGDRLYYAVAGRPPDIGEPLPESWAVPRQRSEPIVFRGGKDDRAVLWTQGSVDAEIRLEQPAAVAPAAGEPG